MSEEIYEVTVKDLVEFAKYVYEVGYTQGKEELRKEAKIEIKKAHKVGYDKGFDYVMENYSELNRAFNGIYG